MINGSADNSEGYEGMGDDVEIWNTAGIVNTDTGPVSGVCGKWGFAVGSLSLGPSRLVEAVAFLPVTIPVLVAKTRRLCVHRTHLYTAAILERVKES